MAMLISKFHKLIQSKLLWLTFIALVVISFVFWGAVTPDAGDRREAASPGTLDGKPVSPELFRQAYFSTYLTVVMAIGRGIDITPRIDEQLRQAAWQRLAALRAAERMGIVVTDDEVASAIQRHEGFQFEGRFNVMAYKSFVQNFLARFGVSERQFEEHVRQEIALQKTRMLIDRTTLATPFELQRAFRTITDRFQVEYVTLPRSLVEAEVAIGKEEARAFYDSAPERFAKPEQVRVDYIRVAAAPFIPRLRVTEEDVQAYYDENLSDFAIEEDDAEEAETTNLFGRLTRYRPLDEVKQEITNILLERKALEEAYETAMNITVALTPDREGNAADFAAVAAQFKQRISTVGPFGLEDDLPGIEDPRAFKLAAFELSEGPDTYFSNPVRGSNEVYVLALRERIPSRVPAFEEVREEATRRARERAVADALLAKAQTVRKEAEDALAQKIGFRETIAFYGLTVSTSGVFSASTGLEIEDEDMAGDIMSAVLTLNAGEISEPIARDDGFLLVHVVSRQPGEMVSLEAVRPQLVERIRRQSGRFMFDAWQTHLLREAKFEDHRARRTEDEEAEEDDGV
jgi:peptidyl-prolyl cis-trans isomerase D